MTQERRRLLVTGAAGHVAGLILPELRVRYRLRRLDVASQQPEGDDEIIRADICDVGLMTDACRDVAGVLQVAAKAFEDDFVSVLAPRNLIGTWSMFDAAVRAGVSHVVFASTGQTVGANPPDVISTLLASVEVPTSRCVNRQRCACESWHDFRRDCRVTASDRGPARQGKATSELPLQVEAVPALPQRSAPDRDRTTNPTGHSVSAL